MSWNILHDYPKPELEASWREFLTRADFPAHYVSPEYFREPFFQEKQPFAILAWQGPKIVAVLTGIREGGGLVCGLESRPQTCFDTSVEPAIIAKNLIEGLRSEAGSATVITLYAWSELKHFLVHGYRCHKEEGVVMLDLTRGADAIFKDFSSTRRTDIRNAIKKGVEVSLASTREEFWAYYDIYVDWCERKNIRPLSLEVSEQAFLLTDTRRLFLARFEGKVVAGTVIRLYPNVMIEYAANSSTKESLKLKPNDLLQWRVIEWACGEGYQRYCVGGPTLFLRKMGGSIMPIYRYRLDRTWFRRHELNETLQTSGRRMFQALPKGVQKQVRRLLGRDS